MTISVSVVGATGRMGSLAVELVDSSADLSLHSKLNSSSSLDASRGADIVIDFTLPSISASVVESAIQAGQSVVVGTSGWSQSAISQLEHRVKSLDNGSRVLVVPNFSIGSTLAQQFAARAARFFDSIEIVEHHHAGKADSPSGTAVRTAELIQASRAGKPIGLIPGVEQPARGQAVAGVPIHSLRMTSAPATQETIFSGFDEQLTIRHLVTSPSAYQQGIYLAITRVASLSGVSVGLESILEI